MVLWLPTVCAASKKFQPVTFYREVRQRLYPRNLFRAQTRVNLGDFAAGRAGNMVVVAPGLVAEAETVRSIGKLDTIKQLQCLQDLYRPEDCRAPDARIAGERHIP